MGHGGVLSWMGVVQDCSNDCNYFELMKQLLHFMKQKIIILVLAILEKLKKMLNELRNFFLMYVVFIMLLHRERDRITKPQTSLHKKRDLGHLLGVCFNDEGDESLECMRWHHDFLRQC